MRLSQNLEIPVLMNMIIILAHVWVGQEDREEVCTRPEYRRKESRESVTYFNLKMQLSRNGCRDCLFAYQGGGYKKKKKEKRIRNSHGENELRKEWYWL